MTTVSYVSTEHFSGRSYWNVTGSCGKYIVNFGDVLNYGDAVQLLDSLSLGQTYKITFEARDHEIIAARRLTNLRKLSPLS